MIPNRPAIDQLVSVYWNITRKCFSIRDHTTKRVLDYTASIFINDCTFTVMEAGRQRVLRTGQKNVHAWVTGNSASYQSLLDNRGLPPLNITWWRPLTTREVTYNPKKYNTFVRRDKTFEPVVVADSVICSTVGEGDAQQPAIHAYRQDMWGEFDQDDLKVYGVMTQAGWAECRPASPFFKSYKNLEKADIIWSQPSTDQDAFGEEQFFFSDYKESPHDMWVRQYGPINAPWGFWDETQSRFIHGYGSMEAAEAAAGEYAATL